MALMPKALIYPVMTSESLLSTDGYRIQHTHDSIVQVTDEFLERYRVALIAWRQIQHEITTMQETAVTPSEQHLDSTASDS